MMGSTMRSGCWLMAKLTVAVAVVDLLFVLSPHVQVDIITKFTVAVVALVLLRGG